MSVLVIQSHNPSKIDPWIEDCLASVRAWARHNAFDYEFIGDELFEPLPDWILEKTASRRVVATDLARLHAIRAAHQNNSVVVWCDADFFVIHQDFLAIDTSKTRGFGREVWIEQDAKRRLRARPKIHNAFMFFSQGDHFLDFYIEAATRMLKRVEGEMVPQFIGPKFLTSLHNMIGLREVKGAAMFSPPVLCDVLAGEGEALDLLKSRQGAPIVGANLSASFVESGDSSALTINEMATVTQKLRSHGDRLFPI